MMSPGASDREAGEFVSDEERGRTSASEWLLRRLDEVIVAAARDVLEQIADHLSIASGDGVTLRVLSADGQWLLPLAAVHATNEINVALRRTMEQTAVAATAGLWEPVIVGCATVTWNVAHEGSPAEASTRQQAFLAAHAVTRVAAAPVVDADGPIGGISLVRFVTDRDFSDADLGLLTDAASRAARAIVFGDLRHLAPPVGP
jgi:GAF domain-containing protein